MTSGQRVAVNAALVLTVLLYALWGMAHSLNDILIAQFKRAFYLSDLQASLVQSSFYIAYLVMPIPVALFLQRYGYKAGFIVGLTMFGVGALLFWPAAEILTYGAFLGALFVIACGMTFLETAGTGIVVVLGAPERAEWRINLAQAFNPIGSIFGVLLGRQFILSRESLPPVGTIPDNGLRVAEAQAVQMPYLLIALAVFAVAIMVAVTRFPVAATRVERDSPFSGLATLLRSRLFVAGVATQFFYVGTQIGMWSFLIRYAQHALPGTSDHDASVYLTVSLVLFLAGRLTVLALLRYWSSAQIALVFSGFAAVLTGVSVLVPSGLGLFALVGVSFFMSVMFPAIFAIGLHGNAAHSQAGAALMIMAIVGGAVLTAAMGAISDEATIAHAYFVPLTGFVIVFLYCGYALRRGLTSATPVAGH